MLWCLPFIAGATLLAMALGGPDPLVPALERHLRSPQLSNKRNIFYQDNLQGARDYILDYWRGLCGLEPTPTCDDLEIVQHYLYHEFEYDWEDYVPYYGGGGGGGEGVTVFPMQYEGENLILVVRGALWGTSADRPLVIGAHYDTFGNSSGVNDNAGGVAALLEISKLVVSSATPRENTLMFVAFDLEEYGTIGSDHFLNAWLVPEVLEKYDIPIESFQGGIILDTVMNYNTTENSQNMTFSTQIFEETHAYLESNNYRGDFISVIGREDDGDLLEAIDSSWNTSTNMQLWKLPFRGSPSVELHDDYLTLTRSDHVRFWEYSKDGSRMKAVFVTDTALYRGDMQMCYHESCDDVTTITAEKIHFLASLTRTMAQVVLKLADNPVAAAAGGGVTSAPGLLSCSPVSAVIAAALIWTL